ncbi:MAG: response regulator [Bryobacteraceae bacterium]
MEQELQVLVIDFPGDAVGTLNMLADESHVFSTWRAGSLLEALDVLARRGFDIIVSELNLQDSYGLKTFETLRLHTRDIPIVIMTAAGNEQLALSAVEQGAQDYLIKGKVTTAALTRVIRYAVARHKGNHKGSEASQTAGRAIGILGAKGGVGATTVAAHFAIHIREQAARKQPGEKILLVDLDANASSTANLFQTKPQFTLADAATNLHRLDRKFWSGIVSETRFGVDLLNPPGSKGCTEMPAAERIRHVVRFARNLYPLVVVDLGVPTMLAMEVIQETRDVVLVATPNLMEMIEARRALCRLSEAGLTAEHVHLLWNRATRHQTNAIHAFEKATGRSAVRTISDCSAEIESAYSDGRLLDPRLPLHRETELLAARLLGCEIAPPSRSLLALLANVGFWREKAPPPPLNAENPSTPYSPTASSQK